MTARPILRQIWPPMSSDRRRLASNNKLPTSELLELIRAVHVVLISLGSQAAPAAEPPVPAVPSRNLSSHDQIVCLEDGKSFKMLKRYQLTDHGMTAE